jgi:leucyl aminopeptidase
MQIRVSTTLNHEKNIIRYQEAGTAQELAAAFRKIGKQKREGGQIVIEPSNGRKIEEFLELAATALCDGAYRFDKNALRHLNSWEVFESRDQLADYGDGEFIFVLSSEEDEEKIKQAVCRGYQQGICKGYARTLGNLPNNYLHTEDMVTYTQKLAGSLGISCQVFKDKELTDMGFGGLLTVNQGSSREAAALVLIYEGAPEGEMTALVGKGLMFDAGGYHLKSIDGMKGMKYDMCGAAGILEALEILVRSHAPRNLMAVLLLAENVINADAVKMGDVITTLAGKTVEIYNTDAEGRLVLCDGITYAQNKGARLVIDLATLTYSAQAALGDQIVGLFTNEEEMNQRWMEMAGQTGEKFWRLPLDAYYHNLLNWSICADFANYAPGKGGGASVAACFLENFIEEGTRWIHLDMVGPSVVRSQTDELAEGASGACIDTIVRFLLG